MMEHLNLIRKRENMKNYDIKGIFSNNVMVVGWLCFTSLRQQGHLETAPPFTVPCEGREAR